MRRHSIQNKRHHQYVEILPARLRTLLSPSIDCTGRQRLRKIETTLYAHSTRKREKTRNSNHLLEVSRRTVSILYRTRLLTGRRFIRKKRFERLRLSTWFRSLKSNTGSTVGNLWATRSIAAPISASKRRAPSIWSYSSSTRCRRRDRR